MAPAHGLPDGPFVMISRSFFCQDHFTVNRFCDFKICYTFNIRGTLSWTTCYPNTDLSATVYPTTTMLLSLPSRVTGLGIVLPTPLCPLM
jgi:hypothetical protein